MKTLFAATDFTPIGNNAVKYAIQLANAMGSTLVVFHAMGMPKFKPTISESQFIALEQKAENQKRKKLESLVNGLYQEFKVKKENRNAKCIVNTGFFVTETLLRAASQHQADMLIVGTHGLIGFKIFGSITSEIILKSKLPVLAIPEKYQYKKMKSIVYATDLNNLVNELKGIMPIAKRLDATIEVLYLDFGWRKSATQQEIAQMAKQSKYTKVKVVVEKEIQGMSILGQIQQYLKDHQPDCLVMFPEERSLFDRLFVRGKTEELVYRTELPMLTYRKSNFETL